MSHNAEAITYTPAKTVEGRKFECKRCHRVYPYPQPGDRPIRCECGWWYANIGKTIREAYWQRIEPYRMPPDVRRLFGS